MLDALLERLKSHHRDNQRLMLLCLALACCFWCITWLSRDIRMQLVVPLTVGNLPAGYQTTARVPGELHVTLSGPLPHLVRARASLKTVTLSLDNAVPGATAHFPHLASQLQLPERVRVVMVSPATLDVELRNIPTSSQGDQHP